MNSNGLCAYEDKIKPHNNGCPILTFYDGKWYIIGMQLDVDKEKSKITGITINRDIVSLFSLVTTL